MMYSNIGLNSRETVPLKKIGVNIFLKLTQFVYIFSFCIFQFTTNSKICLYKHRKESCKLNFNTHSEKKLLLPNGF